MNQDELRLPLMGLEPGDDVDLPGRALGKVREELLVEKSQRPEVESFGNSREEQLQEVPKELIQKPLEELVVSHRLPLDKGDEFQEARPPYTKDKRGSPSSP